MTPETPFSQKPGITGVFVAIIALTISISSNAATTNKQDLTEHEFYLLQHYKLTYTEEIFDFCVEKHGTRGSKVGNCMARHDKLKREILDDAYDQLGRRSVAQSIYDECIDYHPMNGVGRISECVRTRLTLDRKLENDTIEKKIYQKCDFKWRKHGAHAIDNCSRNEANYYRDKGIFRD